MKVDFPELVLIECLERIMETAKDAATFAKAKNERDFIFERLRREVLDEEET